MPNETLTAIQVVYEMKLGAHTLQTLSDDSIIITNDPDGLHTDTSEFVHLTKLEMAVAIGFCIS